MKFYQRRRGQISAVDVAVAIVLFTSVYSLLLASLSNVSIEADEFDALTLKTRIAVSHLLSSSGEPFNWTPSNVSQVGLVVTRSVIEKEKLSNLMNLSVSNPNKLRELLGVAGNSFFFKISYINGTTVTVNSTRFAGPAIIGVDPSSAIVVAHRRIAVYEGARVFVDVKIGT